MYVGSGNDPTGERDNRRVLNQSKERFYLLLRVKAIARIFNQRLVYVVVAVRVK